MSVSALVDPIAVRKALDLVGEDLRGRRMLGEIMVCSGSVFLLRYKWQDDGSRIEVEISLDGSEGPVRQGCDRAGQYLRLVEDWQERLLPRLAAEGSPRKGGFPFGIYPTWERPGLRVVAAPAHLMIPMVFMATLRPMERITMEDMEPAIRIAASEGIRTGKLLRRTVQPFLEGRAGDPDEFEKQVERQCWMFEEAIETFGLGPPLKHDPRSLAQVADCISGHPDWYMSAMFKFEEHFFAETDRENQQSMLDPAPMSTGDRKNDTWIGAVGEHLAQRWNLLVPPWTHEEAFMGGTKPYFRSEGRTARLIEMVETPPAFRRRLIFSGAEPLMSSKFPSSMKVKMPFWH